MDIISLINQFFALVFNPIFLVKVLFVLLYLAFYSVFSLVVAIQISSLTKIINQVHFSTILRFASFLNLTFSIILLLVAVFLV